ncbi:MAG TPA: hypothetical protein VMG10_12260 [Gemmataceae bacterium]|nr:hypothetical protein [Gemmataceae bacterium]
MTPRENELSEQLFDGKEQSLTAMGAVKEALKEFRDAMYPGLTLEKMTSDIGQELKQQVAHGAHELAAALFGHGNSAFVMYPRSIGKDDQPSHDQTQDGQAMQQESSGQHLERGGRSM